MFVLGIPVYVLAPTSLLMAFIQRLTYGSYKNEYSLFLKKGLIAIEGKKG